MKRVPFFLTAFLISAATAVAQEPHKLAPVPESRAVRVEKRGELSKKLMERRVELRREDRIQTKGKALMRNPENKAKRK